MVTRYEQNYWLTTNNLQVRMYVILPIPPIVYMDRLVAFFGNLLFTKVDVRVSGDRISTTIIISI